MWCVRFTVKGQNEAWIKRGHRINSSGSFFPPFCMCTYALLSYILQQKTVNDRFPYTMYQHWLTASDTSCTFSYSVTHDKSTVVQQMQRSPRSIAFIQHTAHTHAHERKRTSPTPKLDLSQVTKELASQVTHKGHTSLTKPSKLLPSS